MQLFRELYDHETVEKVVRDPAREQELFTVQAVREALGAHYVHYGSDVERALFSGFVSMLTHDALVGVTDRHHENWGVIVTKDINGPTPRFAPLYDSARGLFCNMTDTQLARRFSTTNGNAALNKYVSRATPLVGFRKSELEARKSVFNHAQLVGAIFRAYPEQRELISKLLASYDWKRVRTALDTELGSYCSRFRMSLMLTTLRRRLRMLRRAISTTLSC